MRVDIHFVASKPCEVEPPLLHNVADEFCVKAYCYTELALLHPQLLAMCKGPRPARYAIPALSSPLHDSQEV